MDMSSSGTNHERTHEELCQKPRGMNVGGGNAVQRTLTWARAEGTSSNRAKGERRWKMKISGMRLTDTGPRLQLEIWKKNTIFITTTPYATTHNQASASVDVGTSRNSAPIIQPNLPVFRFGACWAGEISGSPSTSSLTKGSRPSR